MLRKQDDVTKYVVRREIKRGDKTFYKSPKVQRLVSEKRLRRKAENKKAKWKAERQEVKAALAQKLLDSKKSAKTLADEAKQLKVAEGVAGQG